MIITNHSPIRNVHGSNIVIPTNTTNRPKRLPASWALPNPGKEATSPEAVLAASLVYVKWGLSLIPIDAELGTKGPAGRLLRNGSWRKYQLRRPTPDELHSWYECGSRYGLAVIGGVVSGGEQGCGLEILDFDTVELAAPWMEGVEKRCPGLIQRLVQTQSPRPGLHFYYRCRHFGNSQKLAQEQVSDENGVRIKTLIERKAEGGYCIVPPSPPRCHPTCQLYQFVDGSPNLGNIPVITLEEREVLLEEAREFDQLKESERVIRQRLVPGKNTAFTPINDFNRRADWEEILGSYGWKQVGGHAEEDYWQRPGKNHGNSATINYRDSGKFKVFTTNAYPFVGGQTYSKFDAYALLNHGGDFERALQSVKDQGYGQVRSLLGAKKRNPKGTIE